MSKVGTSMGGCSYMISCYCSISITDGGSTGETGSGISSITRSYSIIIFGTPAAWSSAAAILSSAKLATTAGMALGLAVLLLFLLNPGLFIAALTSRLREIGMAPVLAATPTATSSLG